MGLERSIRGRYVTIHSDGTLREKVNENDDGATRREYKTRDGATGVKFERVFDSVRGKITNVFFRDGEYGMQLGLTFTDEDENVIHVMSNTQSNFAEDIMKKLPDIDLDHSMWMKPYAFEDDNSKLRKGVTFMQGERKIKSIFSDPDTKELKNGYPAPEGDTKEYDNEDWKMYFMKARKFLIKYTQEHICPRYATKQQKEADKAFNDYPAAGVDYPTDDINPDDIPF